MKVHERNEHDFPAQEGRHEQIALELTKIFHNRHDVDYNSLPKGDHHQQLHSPKLGARVDLLQVMVHLCLEHENIGDRHARRDQIATLPKQAQTAERRLFRANVVLERRLRKEAKENLVGCHCRVAHGKDGDPESEKLPHNRALGLELHLQPRRSARQHVVHRHCCLLDFPLLLSGMQVLRELGSILADSHASLRRLLLDTQHSSVGANNLPFLHLQLGLTVAALGLEHIVHIVHVLPEFVRPQIDHEVGTQATENQ
mmetsp:Transcript_35863/g.86291  ORF Transcript_35863/g.86291 Transcript_35863/m.86291 type:complete len:257 (-) Transcript_35863:797-1567(-)